MVWIYALASVFLVSLISFIGVFALSIKQDKLEKYLDQDTLQLIKKIISNTGYVLFYDIMKMV